jgi:hypothetical protein
MGHVRHPPDQARGHPRLRLFRGPLRPERPWEGEHRPQWGRDYLRAPELNGAVPIVGAPGAGVLGPVLLQVGTAFVVPTDGQVYDPTDGAVTVPT